jgi:hypothetical protein
MATMSKSPPVGRASYPWDIWLDGKARDLKRGDDFTILPHNLKAMIYQSAKRFGVKAIVNIVDDNTLRLQAVLPEKKPKASGGKHRKV